MLCARKHDYFSSCDIRHMFRKIEINPGGRHFQKVFRNQDPTEPIRISKLKTVTYCATPECYLSTRVLKQLAIDEEYTFLIADNVTLLDVYLDDILTGCSNLLELEILKSELNLYCSLKVLECLCTNGVSHIQAVIFLILSLINCLKKTV
ncbi:DUF1758 domain-containing protein [Nephila pilipes]|uniref:DUF1758 domain-containing protein n=1 Tax=Nephila pilipes TaxID=299642 RepID=A0A8X6PAU4_NEPPI|nr:DUF1758 domain-containing protein [Nephila pilipes]